MKSNKILVIDEHNFRFGGLSVYFFWCALCVHMAGRLKDHLMTNQEEEEIPA